MKKHVSVEDLIAKKAGRKDTAIITIEGLGEIEAARLPMKHVLELMSKIDDDDIVSQMNFGCQLIYESCSIFRSQELHQAYNVKRPSDIVMAVFEGEMDAIGAICSQLLEQFYGVVEGKELQE